MQHTNEQIANDFELWREYMNIERTMTEDEFNRLSTEKKTSMLVYSFGKDNDDIVSPFEDPPYQDYA